MKMNRELAVFLAVLFIFLALCVAKNSEPLWSMGIGGVDRRELNSTLNQMTEQIYTDIKKTQADSKASSVQIIDNAITIKGDAVECNVSQLASASAVVTASVDLVMESIQNVGLSNEQKIADAVVMDIEKSTGWGSISTDVGGKSELTTNINTNITNIMNQTFRDEKWLNSMASSVQMVGNELVIEGSCIGSVLSQGANLQASVTASTAMQDFSEKISENKYIADISKKLKVKERESTQGVGGAIKEGAEGISSIFDAMALPFIASSSVSCVLMVVLLLVALSPSGQGAIATGTNVAARKF